MGWFIKNYSDAKESGDTIYNPGATDAIRGFIANHNGSAGRAGIINYLAEMYDTSEEVARNALWRLTQSGELTQEGNSYISEDGLSDWG